VSLIDRKLNRAGRKRAASGYLDQASLRETAASFRHSVIQSSISLEVTLLNRTIINGWAFLPLLSMLLVSDSNMSYFVQIELANKLQALQLEQKSTW